MRAPFVPVRNQTASSGHARADAPRAAVGRVALLLRLFLLRDETARPELTTAPASRATLRAVASRRRWK